MAETQQPVLIYDRIDANRRNTFLLLVMFVVLLAGASIAMGISQDERDYEAEHHRHLPTSLP